MSGLQIVIQVGVDLHSVDFCLQKVNRADAAGRAILSAQAPARRG